MHYRNTHRCTREVILSGAADNSKCCEGEQEVQSSQRARRYVAACVIEINVLDAAPSEDIVLNDLLSAQLCGGRASFQRSVREQ
ncbi:jg17774 [Pararge aegeria aegeria]|uniref:Jg17774 protein n=1 Tax=Pararge aegeria aegeria TaxID=348720 RepID=A0A8S4RDU4_9NEOP|nr:jg17774 [Pararge aegeria aegeria]